MDIKTDENDRLVTYEVDELQQELPLRQLVDSLVGDRKHNNQMSMFMVTDLGNQLNKNLSSAS